MEKQYQRFADFYPYYLGEHRNPICRRLHLVGTFCVLAIGLFALLSGRYAWLWLVPLCGYGFAWVGHFFFEKNRPATFTYPLYSLAADFVMFFQAITGRLRN